MKKFVIIVYEGVYYKSHMEDTSNIKEAKVFDSFDIAQSVRYAFCLAESRVKELEQ